MKESWGALCDSMFISWHVVVALWAVLNDKDALARRHARLVGERLEELHASPARIAAIKYALGAGSVERTKYSFEELIREQQESEQRLAEIALGRAYECPRCHRWHPAGPCENFSGILPVRIKTDDAVPPGQAVLVSPKDMHTMSAVVFDNGKIKGPYTITKPSLEELIEHE